VIYKISVNCKIANLIDYLIISFNLPLRSFFGALLFSGKDRLIELSNYVFLYKIQHRDIVPHAKPSNSALYAILNSDAFSQLGSWTYNTKPLSSFPYKKQKRMGVNIFYVGFFFFEQEKGRKRL
jgi:hypothetical protein